MFSLVFVFVGAAHAAKRISSSSENTFRREEGREPDDERLKYEANSVKSQVQLSVESLRADDFRFVSVRRSESLKLGLICLPRCTDDGTRTSSSLH